MRYVWAVVLAAAALSAAVSGASANRLSVSSQNFRMVWRSLVFKNTINAGVVLCPITLEGSFHSATISKTVGALIGYVKRASVRGEEPPCIGGTMSVLAASLPWHITYFAFTGTLPTIRTMHILLPSLQIQVHIRESLTCLASAEARTSLWIRVPLDASGRATGLEMEEEPKLPLTGEAGLCALGRGFFGREEAGTFTTETGAGVTVRLI